MSLFDRWCPGDRDKWVSGLSGHSRVGMSSRRGTHLLIVDPEGLALRCLRTYRFAPHEVVAIERGGPAWLDAGVRIVHNRADYPKDMHFHCSGGAEAVAALLNRSGFVCSGKGPACGKPGLLPAARLLLLGGALLVFVSILIGLFRWAPIS